MTDKTNMTDTDVRKKVMRVAFITGGIALVVGFGAGAAFFRESGSAVRNDSSTEKGSSTSTMDSETSNGTDNNSALSFGSALSAPSVAAITVSDQKAGDTAMVSLISTDSTSWLALRENNDGILGNILGAKRLDVGTSGNVEIPLLRATQAGNSYTVVLFKDNGDKVFDFKTDAPMTSNGTLISKTFTVN